MVKTEVFTGKTVDDAIQAGLEALNVARDDVTVEVLDEGKKKLFGKSSPAEVRLTVQDKRTDGERAVDFLKGLFELLKEEATPSLECEDERIVIQLAAPSSKGLIGRRGEIIDAVQILAGAVANTGRKEYKRVVVDFENYREHREETLRRVAEKLAAKAVRNGKRVRLEPMNPYERRIIHSALVDNPDVTTKSEGKEPARYVVITPKNMRPYDRNKKFGGNKKYGDNKKFDGNRKYGERKPYPKRELPKEDTPVSSGTTMRPTGSSSTGFRKSGFSGFFGTFLGNARDDEAPQTSEDKDE